MQFQGNNFFGCRFFMLNPAGPGNDADLATFASTVHSQWSSHMNAYLSSNYSLTQVQATEIGPGGGGYGLNTVALGGGHSSPSPSEATCTVLDLHIFRKYRGGKPKIFLPTGTLADLANQVSWLTTYTGNINTAWAAFIAGLVAATTTTVAVSEQINVSYYSGHNTSTPPWRGPGYKYPPLKRTTPVIDAITSVQARVILGSQRRRLTAGS